MLKQQEQEAHIEKMASQIDTNSGRLVRLETDISIMRADIITIRDNHLHELKEALANARETIVALRVDILWLKDSLWKFAVPGLLACVGIVIEIVINYRK